VVLAGSTPQKAEFLVHNWSATPAEARADNDRSRVYLSYIPSIGKGVAGGGVASKGVAVGVTR
jgi:hypothetical protein